MFVRILHEDTEDLYECGRVNLRPHDEQEGAILVDMEGIPGIGQCAHVAQKGRDEVYIMDGSGQTIDSYRWEGINMKNENLEIFDGEGSVRFGFLTARLYG